MLYYRPVQDKLNPYPLVDLIDEAHTAFVIDDFTNTQKSESLTLMDFICYLIQEETIDPNNVSFDNYAILDSIVNDIVNEVNRDVIYDKHIEAYRKAK